LEFRLSGDSEARQVLVIDVERTEMIDAIMTELMSKMRLLLPAGQYMDIVPFASSSIPKEARVESCRVFGAPRKPWWKVW